MSTGPAPHRWFAGFIGFNALAAWGGAFGLASGVLAMGDELNRRLPFASPVLGGLALALIVAAPLTLLAYDAWTGATGTAAVSAQCGVLLVGWIVIQLAMLRTFSPLQPFYLAVGTMLIVWGRRHADGIEALS